MEFRISENSFIPQLVRNVFIFSSIWLNKKLIQVIHSKITNLELVRIRSLPN